MEPDLALNYDELGDVYSLLQQDSNAEKSYREALRIDPRLVNSYVGLAKAYRREEKYQQALRAIDSAEKLNADAPDIHYLRGQVLVHLGRGEQGKKEMETSVRIDNERRAERERQVESGTVRRPNFCRTSRRTSSDTLFRTSCGLARGPQQRRSGGRINS